MDSATWTSGTSAGGAGGKRVGMNMYWDVWMYGCMYGFFYEHVCTLTCIYQ